MTVINPIRIHTESCGEAGPVFARASYIFQLGHWRARRRIAEARNDFDALDRLDAEYERLGLP